MKQFKANEDSFGQRLDVFLAEELPELSRSFIKKLCEDGKITVNGQPARVSYKLKALDKVQVNYSQAELQRIPEIDLPIIYEDDDCLVINKPAGVLTHSKGAFNPEATVATFIEKYWQGSEDQRAGIVHRLDRGTSGVIICAKHPAALDHLQKQFNQRKTKKTYQAIVASGLDPAEAVIDMPIARNPKTPKTFHVSSLGKPAQTHYKVIKTAGQYCLLELRPVTGRTHQLRVHLAQLKRPIVGDDFYKGQPADRLYLHALSLELTLPNGKQQVFKAPLPASFNNWLKNQNHAE